MWYCDESKPTNMISIFKKCKCNNPAINESQLKTWRDVWDGQGAHKWNKSLTSLQALPLSFSNTCPCINWSAAGWLSLLLYIHYCNHTQYAHWSHKVHKHTVQSHGFSRSGFNQYLCICCCLCYRSQALEVMNCPFDIYLALKVHTATALLQQQFSDYSCTWFSYTNSFYEVFNLVFVAFSLHLFSIQVMHMLMHS